MTNKQNDTIKAQLAQVNVAVNTLLALGLTVNSFSVVDQRPLIYIQPGFGTGQLKGGYTKYFNRNGIRMVERVSLICECQVKWEEAA